MDMWVVRTLQWDNKFAIRQISVFMYVCVDGRMYVQRSFLEWRKEHFEVNGFTSESIRSLKLDSRAALRGT